MASLEHNMKTKGISQLILFLNGKMAGKLKGNVGSWTTEDLWTESPIEIKQWYQKGLKNVTGALTSILMP